MQAINDIEVTAQTDAARGSVADIVARDLSPLVRAIDEDGIYPERVFRALGEAGAFGRHLDGRAADGGLSAAIADMAEIGRLAFQPRSALGARTHSHGISTARRTPRRASVGSIRFVPAAGWAAPASPIP